MLTEDTKAECLTDSWFMGKLPYVDSCVLCAALDPYGRACCLTCCPPILQNSRFCIVRGMTNQQDKFQVLMSQPNNHALRTGMHYLQVICFNLQNMVPTAPVFRNPELHATNSTWGTRCCKKMKIRQRDITCQLRSRFLNSNEMKFLLMANFQ